MWVNAIGFNAAHLQEIELNDCGLRFWLILGQMPNS